LDTGSHVEGATVGHEMFRARDEEPMSPANIRQRAWRKQNSQLSDRLGNATSSSLQLVVSNHGDIRDVYDLLDILGKGGFGMVRRAQVRATGAGRAVKEIKKTFTKEGKLEHGRLKLETVIMSSVDHPNVVRLWEVFEDDSNAYLVMELCTGGTLSGLLTKRGFFQEDDAALAMQQILRATTYLHMNSICHRDLKAKNCLLKDHRPSMRNRVSVADFGLSCKFKPKQIFTLTVGTSSHMAPEVWMKKYNHSCDIWSCGVIAYNLLCSKLPFGKDAQKIKHGSLSFEPFVACGNTVSKCGIELIEELLKRKPQHRCTARKALQHQWFKLHAPHRNAMLASVTQDLIEQLRGFRSLNRLKQAALSIAASILSENDISSSRELFLALDLDGDGLLSASELRDRLRRSASSVDTARVEGVVQPFAQRGKREKYNSLLPLKPFTYTEFLAATFNRRHCLTNNVLKIVFSNFDRDGDGVISLAELASGRMLGHLPPEEIAQTLQDLDKNKDSQIDFLEFSSMMFQQDDDSSLSTNGGDFSRTLTPHSRENTM